MHSGVGNHPEIETMKRPRFTRCRLSHFDNAESDAVGPSNPSDTARDAEVADHTAVKGRRLSVRRIDYLFA